MAHLWVFDTANEWVARLLSGDAMSLADVTGPCVLSAQPAAEAAAQVLLHRAVDPPDTWAILTTEPRLRVNGLPVPLGLAVLEDRDEIRVPGMTAWFSTEARARVEPFPDATTRGCCPRCKQGIDPATPAVRCPLCGLWHHASDELPCWTYAATCATCSQDTALDAGFRWTPEDL